METNLRPGQKILRPGQKIQLRKESGRIGSEKKERNSVKGYV